MAVPVQARAHTQIRKRLPLENAAARAPQAQGGGHLRPGDRGLAGAGDQGGGHIWGAKVLCHPLK